MSQKPVTMEQLKQILQLRCDGIGIREIARRTGISRNSVRKYLGLLPTTTRDEDSAEISNRDLADRAYNNDQLEHDTVRLEQLSQHFAACQSELSKTGVTRQLLWQEYLGLQPDGYSYSRYCYHLKQYLQNS